MTFCLPTPRRVVTRRCSRRAQASGSMSALSERGSASKHPSLCGTGFALDPEPLQGEHVQSE
jgi:hypothetical protein